MRVVVCGFLLFADKQEKLSRWCRGRGTPTLSHKTLLYKRKHESVTVKVTVIFLCDYQNL